MTLSLIVATDRRRVIGRDNAMPWYLPSDLRFFKRVTTGKTLLMGRKTYCSIGRPLPGRRVIVVSAQTDFSAPGCELAGSLEQALALAGPGEVMVGGGGTLYAQTLDRAERIYLTEVDAEVAGDVTFPALDWSAWQSLWCQTQPQDDRHPYGYRRRLLLRRKGIL